MSERASGGGRSVWLNLSMTRRTLLLRAPRAVRRILDIQLKRARTRFSRFQSAASGLDARDRYVLFGAPFAPIVKKAAPQCAYVERWFMLCSQPDTPRLLI